MPKDTFSRDGPGNRSSREVRQGIQAGWPARLSIPQAKDLWPDSTASVSCLAIPLCIPTLAFGIICNHHRTADADHSPCGPALSHCRFSGDGQKDQAVAVCGRKSLGLAMISNPSANFTPWMIFCNWLWPSRRRQVFCGAVNRLEHHGKRGLVRGGSRGSDRIVSISTVTISPQK